MRIRLDRPERLHNKLTVHPLKHSVSSPTFGNLKALIKDDQKCGKDF